MKAIDDKIAVIFAVSLITCIAMFVLKGGSKEVVMSALTGLMGIAVGKGLQ